MKIQLLKVHYNFPQSLCEELSINEHIEQKCFWQMKNMVEGFFKEGVKLYLTVALFTYISLRVNPASEAEAML